MIDLLTGSNHSVESNWQPSAREDSILYTDLARQHCFHFMYSNQHSIASNSFGSTVHGLYVVLILVLELQIK